MHTHHSGPVILFSMNHHPGREWIRSLERETMERTEEKKTASFADLALTHEVQRAIGDPGFGEPTPSSPSPSPSSMALNRGFPHGH
jgi:hypothetical protein